MRAVGSHVVVRIAIVIAAGAASPPICAQVQSGSADPIRTWDVTQPRGQTRKISFTTDEGTWLSPDVSRDGRTIVFDMAGDIWTLPIEGGEAKVGEAVRLGANGYVRKPFTADQIKEKLVGILDQMARI